MSVLDIARDISEGLGRMAPAGELNGEVVDLRHEVDEDCSLNILTANDPEGLAAYRHTTSHIMAQAIKRLYPQAKLAIGPSIADGFYYDIDIEGGFTPEDLEKIEAEMKKIIKEALPLKRFTLPRDEAVAFMRDRQEPYKVELIEDLPEGSEISFYEQGEFVDLCAGPHLMTTTPVKAFKLLKGYRGAKPCDIDALCDTIIGIGNYAAANKDVLKELDINPLFIYEEGEGVGLADALIVKYKE